MAIEAARQMQILSRSTASTLIVSGVDFHEPLALESMTEADLDLEIQCIARWNGDTGKFDFEVFSAKLESQQQWRLHCTGMFGWLATPISGTEPVSRDTAHETSLGDNWQSLGHRVPECFSQLKVNERGCTAHFQQDPYRDEEFFIDPRVLHSAIHLSSIPLVSRNLPVRYTVSSIASIQIPINGKLASSGHVAIDVHPNDPYGIRCNLTIHQAKDFISAQDICFKVRDLIAQSPASSSPFFKASIKPDITSFSGDRISRFSWLAALLGHKWPMSDIGIQGLKSETIQVIFDAFGAQKQEKRRLFRIIDIIKKSATTGFGSIRYVQRFDTSMKYHVLFTDDLSDPQYVCDRLRPKGLWFSRIISNDRDENADFHKLFTPLSSVTGLGKGRWRLWRKQNLVARTAKKVTLFGSGYPKKAEDLGHIEHIHLDHNAISGFCSRISKERFNAIIMDDPDFSVITTWPGKIIIPWVQRLLKSADTILWVTRARPESPFQQVAGALLRTIQSELPSLKVCWLVHAETDRTDRGAESLWNSVEGAYFSLHDDDNEIKLVSSPFYNEIVRYCPDDELSSTVGLIPPLKVESSLIGKEYELTFAAPQQPVILSYTSPRCETSSKHDMKVSIEASVIGPEDACAFQSSDRRTHQQCKFFAGRILGGKKAAVKGGDRVIGYTTYPHGNITSIPSNQLFKMSDKLPFSEAASEFAAVAVASCIVDGETRAREGDTFDVQVQGVLKAALDQLIERVGARILTSGESSEVDFTVTFDVSQGLLVSRKNLNLVSYISSGRGRAMVEQAWHSRRPLLCPLKTVAHSKYAEAFTLPSTYTQPYSTTISHGSAEQAVEHVPVYRENVSLLSSSGQYILIGGVGGLGRFICAWMVQHGARNLIVVSRSGPSTSKATEMQASISSYGASLQVFEADACDRERMCDILLKVRQNGPIQGIINLAMVLGDAPMASMTGAEWDRALRVKIDSSWILHEETLDDNLDFFILFSSIASICGNRNQGNYNVANAFLNALAEYRHSLNRPGISIALGAMSMYSYTHQQSPFLFASSMLLSFAV